MADTETQSGTYIRSCCKTLEDGRQQLFFNAFTRIFDGNDQTIADIVDSCMNRSFVRMLAGIEDNLIEITV